MLYTIFKKIDFSALAAIHQLRKIIGVGKLNRWGLLLAFLSIISILKAQDIKGYVYSLDGTGKKVALSGANVYLAGSKKVTSTDSTGFFTFPKIETGFLFASFVGYNTDSLTVSNGLANNKIEFLLKPNTQLNEVAVKGNQKGTFFLKTDVVKTEYITNAGLMKMACCNLAESFENSATITAVHTDAVSGAKQVQLLGLSGIYGQVLAENIPTMRGLAYSFGWNYTPGAWLESIQISKGTSSVINGYESVTGQINLEYKKPEKQEDLFAEFYTDLHGRTELNITGSRQVTKNLWANLLVNASISTWSNYFLDDSTAATLFHDRNRDHFMDVPESKSINVFNRWLYVSPSGRLQSRTGIRFLYEKRHGGQSPKCHLADAYYTTDIVNQNFTVYNKTGIAIGNKPGQSLGIINNFTNYKLESLFGSDRTYKLFFAYQKSFLSNLIFNSYIGNTNHKYGVGASFLFDDYDTCFRDKLPENNTPLTSINRVEIVPGIFGEYTYTGSKFTSIVGLREDYNSKYGWLFTPRVNLKYSITDNIIARVSAGRGYRSPNLISDNIGLMASTRKFDIESIGGLNMEKAWNYGGNLTFYIPINSKGKKLVASFDYFHTRFDNHAIVDLDRDKNDVYFYNSTGSNYNNVWQADISFSPFQRFDVFAAFRYNQHFITLTDGKNSFLAENPLISRYRGLVNLAYATKFRKLVIDFTAQINGPARIPSSQGYTAHPVLSPAYPVLFFQVTKNTKRFDMYIGAENILDYRQKDPIISANNPFVKGFDASQIWGPLMGRKIYAGIRLRLGKTY